jgi:hypothetical protein
MVPLEGAVWILPPAWSIPYHPTSLQGRASAALCASAQSVHRRHPRLLPGSGFGSRRGAMPVPTLEPGDQTMDRRSHPRRGMPALSVRTALVSLSSSSSGRAVFPTPCELHLPSVGGPGFRLESSLPAVGSAVPLVVTWLILPVVICLPQRLSHACLSISIILRNCVQLLISVRMSWRVLFSMGSRSNSRANTCRPFVCGLDPVSPTFCAES